MSIDAVAAALAKTVQGKIEQARTMTRRGTVTAVGSDGTVQFSVGTLGTRVGISVIEMPRVGDVIAYLDEGNGMPLVLGKVGVPGAWSTYVPAWTSSGAAPAVGNGSIVGRYRRNGGTLHVQAQLFIGSTSTLGSGAIRFGLPSGMTLAAVQQQTGSGFWYDASTGILTPAVAIGEAGGTYVYLWIGTGASPGDSAGLGDGDNLKMGGTFEIVP